MFQESRLERPTEGRIDRRTVIYVEDRAVDSVRNQEDILHFWTPKHNLLGNGGMPGMTSPERRTDN